MSCEKTPKSKWKKLEVRALLEHWQVREANRRLKSFSNAWKGEQKMLCRIVGDVTNP